MIGAGHLWSLAIAIALVSLGTVWALGSTEPDDRGGQDHTAATEAAADEEKFDSSVRGTVHGGALRSDAGAFESDQAVTERVDAEADSGGDGVATDAPTSLLGTHRAVPPEPARDDSAYTAEAATGGTGDWRAPILDPASQRISFQALLTDNVGDPLPGPTVNLQFNIYDGAIVVVEGPINMAGVPINHGVVDVQIPVTPGTFDGSERLLGIRVDGGPELVPLTPLTAVPYAFRVDRVKSEELTDNVSLGDTTSNGSMRIFNSAIASAAVTIEGSVSTMTFYGFSNGNKGIELLDRSFGEIRLYDDADTNETVSLSATGGSGGELLLADSSGVTGVFADGGSGTVNAGSSLNVVDIAAGAVRGALSLEDWGAQIDLADENGVQTLVGGSGVNAGGYLQFFQADGGHGVEIDGDASNSNGGGDITLYASDGNAGIFVDGDDGNNDGGGRIEAYAADGSTSIVINGDSAGAGYITVRNNGGDARVQLDGEAAGTGGRVAILDADGSVGVELLGAETDLTGGRIQVRDAGGGTRVSIDGESTGTGGEISIDDSTGNETIELLGAQTEATGGRIQVRDAGGNTRVTMDGDSTGGAGEVSVFNDSNVETVEILGDESNNASQILLRDQNATDKIEIDAQGGSGARIQVFQDDGTSGITMDGQNVDNGSQLRMFANDGSIGVWLRANSVAGGTPGAGRILVYDSTGAASVYIDGDYNNSGMGRVRADIIRVQGGVDLAEPFACRDKAAVKPGMVMSIDPDSPGGLMITTQAYDRKVAGVVSGAGGVQPGIMLTQEGVIEGDHPVALTGRVYCWCDASFGAIEPGDLLTTSNTPGHAMKVTDYAKSQGATIGKAMTTLAKGKGLVLLLVQPQ